MKELFEVFIFWLLPKRLFITECAGDKHDADGDADEKKCSGCLNITTTFYGIGKTREHARRQFTSEFEGNDAHYYGAGLCGQCIAEVINEGEYILK